MNPPSITPHFPGLLGSSTLHHRCCRKKFKIDIKRKKNITRKAHLFLSLSTYRKQCHSMRLPAAVTAAFTGYLSLFECAVCIFMSILSIGVDSTLTTICTICSSYFLCFSVFCLFVCFWVFGLFVLCFFKQHRIPPISPGTSVQSYVASCASLALLCMGINRKSNRWLGLEGIIICCSQLLT